MNSNEIGQNFSRAVDYDAAARVQARAAHRLGNIIQALYPSSLQPKRILEVGSGTGLMTQELLQRFPDAHVTVTDISSDMLERCRKKMRKATLSDRTTYLAMDGERPCLEWAFDLICANFCVQWFRDRRATYQKWASYLNPYGRIAVSTLIEGSFAEWHAACRAEGIPLGFDHWPSQECVAREFPAQGLSRWTSDRFRDPIGNAYDFLKDIRRIGAAAPLQKRRPVSAGSLMRVMRHFDQKPPVMTYHVGFGVYQRPDYVT